MSDAPPAVRLTWPRAAAALHRGAGPGDVHCPVPGAAPPPALDLLMTDPRRSWIDEPDDDATPDVRRATKVYRRQGRRTPSVIGVMKCAPATLTAVRRMNQAVTFGGSSLGRVREELVATTTSALNDCFY